MNKHAKKWLKFVIRWGIAVIGIAYVLSQISLQDEVKILDSSTQLPIQVHVLNTPSETDASFVIVDPDHPHQTLTVDRSQLWTDPDVKNITIRTPDGGTETVKLLALQPRISLQTGTPPAHLLYKDPQTGHGVIINPDQLVSEHLIQVPTPLVEIGLFRRLREANGMLLALAMAIFPLTYIITSIRWWRLLAALDIHVTLARTFAINMVGAFYNSFMPGSTGGDLLKAYYVAKQTPHRTRAIMSVLVDRVLGLLSLILLGGVMATVQYLVADASQEAIAQSCLKVALLCAGMLGGTGVALFLAYHPFTRKWMGIGFLISKLPMQQQVHRVIEVMGIYRRRPVLVLGAIIGTLPVHITVVFSAMMAGLAFDLPLHKAYYFVAVPVIVLVGAIPLSPQGLGVMEYFAIKLTERHGVSVAQALILTMAIRMIQLLWNLSGGIFVFRGGYHAPNAKEQHELESDDADNSSTASTSSSIPGGDAPTSAAPVAPATKS